MNNSKNSLSTCSKILIAISTLTFALPLQALTKNVTEDQNKRMAQLEKKTHDLEKQINLLKNNAHKPAEDTQALKSLKQARAYTRGTSVMTSPYIGIYSEYENQDLFASLPDIHEDYELLDQRKKLNERAKTNHIAPHYPLVDLSGIVDVTAWFEKPYIGHHKSDINLNDTKIDIVGEITSWATAFVGLNYDSSLASTSAQRIGNSKVIIDKGFLLIGDLNRSPFYGSIGQIYIPFGDYRSYLVSDPLTTKIGEISARAISLGYHAQDSNPHHLYGNIYAFQGDSRVGAFNPLNSNPYHNDKINRWGINIGDVYTQSKIKAEARVGYITSLTDSNGMQSTSDLGFGGFGLSSYTEVLAHRVPGASVSAKIAYQPYTLITEFVTVTQDFNKRDMTYDHHGAQPRAFHIEGVQHFYLTPAIPSTLTLGLDKTFESIALGLPEYRYSVSLNTNPIKDVLAAIEIRHDRNYGKKHNGTGAGLPIMGLDKPGHSATRITTFLQYQF